MLEKEKLNKLFWCGEEWEEEEEEEEEETIEEEEDKGKEKEEEENDKGKEKEEEEEEDVNEYFDPFGKKIEAKKPEKEEEDKEEGKKETEVVMTNNKDSEARAKLEAIDIVDEYIDKHPEFKDLKKTLREFSAKAILQGMSKPLEFAIRNVQTPEYWVNYGKKLGVEDAKGALNTRLGGIGTRKGSEGSPDYGKMSSEDFMKEVNEVLSHR